MDLTACYSFGGPIAKVFFSPRGNQLLILAADKNHNAVLTLQDQELIPAYTFGNPSDPRLFDAAFHPSLPLLATAGAERMIEIHDSATGQKLRELGTPPAADTQPGYTSLAFDARGERLFAARWGSEGTDVFNFSDGRLAFTYWGRGSMDTLALHPEAQLMANTLFEQGACAVRFLHLDRENLVPLNVELENFMDTPHLAWSPDGAYLAALGGFPGPEVCVFRFPECEQVLEWYGEDDVPPPAQPWTLSHHTPLVAQQAFSADGTTLWCPGASGNLVAVDLGSGQVARRVPAHREAVCAIQAHHASGRMASAGRDGRVCLWKTPKNEPVTADLKASRTQGFLARARPTTPFPRQEDLAVIEAP
ncbi:WD40 repeat domain-containing protein [Acanthopleuribacter pedis]|uniref:WD40 repeat domain-containing protein n=1 Tax=Acanthopleuribacter pedis TaxID=442870 RepID=A0A8J7QDG3_9BACT|nr:hypothetical protein [Acanthopleuribacter pedis]MBO1322512.1 hypothetical protein [Acanthopleuribacter pedis]